MINFERLIAETGAKLVSVRSGIIVGGTEADSDTLAGLSGIAPLSKATVGDLAFITNVRFREELLASKAGVVIMSEGFAEGYSGKALIHENPYWVYAKAACLFQEGLESVCSKSESEIADSASLSPAAQLGKGVSVGAGAVVADGAVVGDYCVLGPNTVVEKNVRLGHGVRLAAGAKVLQDCIIGDDVTLDSGVVVGSEGFGFAPHHENDQLRWQRIAQLGIVNIGSRVYIGANTTIDRGAIEDTIIEDDVIIDNQVQIAHNCRIGKGSAIAGCVGMAGSSIIGERCSIGGGAGIAGHLSIADDTTVLGMTLINKTVKKRGVFASGTGMQVADQWRKSAVRFTQLEELNQRVRKLEKKIHKD